MGAGSSLSKPTTEVIATLPADAQAELRKMLLSPLVCTSLPQPMKEIAADTSKTCVQRVQEALDEIAAKEGDLNACIEILKESALKTAAEADEKLAGGAARRPLEGVPLLVKGNVDVGRLMSFMKVVDDQICFKASEVYNVYDLFHTRANMHQKVYTHKKVRRRCSTRSSAAV